MTRALRLPPLPSVRDLLRQYRLRALRQLSQNFLLDERSLARLARAAGDLRGHCVCEVGPGPGSLTRALLRRGPARLVLVEKDARFLPSLELLADACRHAAPVDIVLGDILATDLAAFLPPDARRDWTDAPPPVTIVGNLPFSVSTALLVRWLRQISERTGAWAWGRTRLTLTFQKEVAERMAAPLTHPQRCRLSVMCQAWCKVNYQLTIPGSAFRPRPDVDVGVVTLTPLRVPLVSQPFPLVERVVRQVFHMRQKYALRGAGTLFPAETRAELAARLFRLAELDPAVRPFRIANTEFSRLCDAYALLLRELPHLQHYDYRAPRAAPTPPPVLHSPLSQVL